MQNQGKKLPVNPALSQNCALCHNLNKGRDGFYMTSIRHISGKKHNSHEI